MTRIPKPGLLLLALLLAPVCAAAESFEPLAVMDTAGVVHAVGDSGARATAVIFLGPTCPISRAEIPTLNALAATYRGREVELYGVVSEAASWSEAGAFARDFQVSFPLLVDATGDLAAALHPEAVPEAFVIDRDLQVVYHGQIDNAYLEVGRSRRPTSHELDDALAAAEEGRPPPPATEPVGCAFEGPVAGLDGGVTFDRQIAPIVLANCTGCHRAREVAPFPLETYADVASHAAMVARVTGSGRMPPWKPDPGFVHFHGERHLSDHEVQLIRAWVASGAPEGDSHDSPPQPSFEDGWALGPPDRILEMPQAFPIPAGGPDVYRSFVIPARLDHERRLVAVEFRPGVPEAVHHALLYLDPTGAAHRLDVADPGPGFTVFGGPGFPGALGIGAWGPGLGPESLPQGMAYSAPAHADVVFQMHYHPTGKPERDRSRIGLYFARGPTSRVVGNLMLTRFDLDIPAGKADYVKEIEVTLPEAITVIGIVPHLHLLARDIEAVATRPDGRSVPLLRIPDWDFRWQAYYRYREPIELPAGTRVRIRAHWDNSDANPDNPHHPPRRVTFGLQSEDEMFFCPLQIAAHSDGELQRLQEEIIAEQSLAP